MELPSSERSESFSRLLFSQPTYFDVKYKINPYMDENVSIGDFRKNWTETISRIRDFATVETVDFETFSTESKSVENLPDIVFCANHGVPIPSQNGFILSNMKHEERKPEVEYFNHWAQNHGYETIRIQDGVSFEGCGDAKWHPSRDLLWVGHGPRTDRSAVEEIRGLIDSKVVGLELTSDTYYHLDVCFTALDKKTVMIVPDGLSDSAEEKIRNGFDSVLIVPEEDRDTMGGNAARVSENVIAIDKQNAETIEMLRDNDYKVVTVPTEEFQKSGGSVDCLFLRVP